MNKNIKIIILVAAIAIIVIIIAILVLNLSGSTKKLEPMPTQTESEQTATSSIPPKPTNLITPTPAPTPDPTPSGILIVEEDVIDIKNNTVTYEYYDVGEDKKKTETVEVTGDTTLTTVLEVVAKNFFDKNLASSAINPNSVSMVGENVYIDFKNDIYTVPLGSSGEGSLLNSIYYGYINNVTGVKNVYISVAGNDYSSGHTSFTKNKPYTP